MSCLRQALLWPGGRHGKPAGKSCRHGGSPLSWFPRVQNHSRDNYRTSRNEHKTYGSVFGTIFLGGVGSPLVIETQRLATQKVPKKRENAKKSAK
jgi:hypothetical protein